MYEKNVSFNYYFIAGIVGPVFYTFLLILLGYMWTGYNPVIQSMSEIGSVVSPFKNLMNYLGFSLLGIYISLFAVGLYKEFRQSTVVNISLLLLLIAGVTMFLVGFYPCDAGCVDITKTSKMHSVMSTFPSITLPLSAMLMAFELFKRWGKKWGYVSFSLGFLSLSAGPVMFLPFSVSYLGLIQRFGIGFSLMWIFIVSIKNSLDQCKVKRY